jgi:hypothetical protein
MIKVSSTSTSHEVRLDAIAAARLPDQPGLRMKNLARGSSDTALIEFTTGAYQNCFFSAPGSARPAETLFQTFILCRIEDHKAFCAAHAFFQSLIT